MRCIRRHVRAISPVLAVLMMIAVAIAGSLVVYAWIMGYIGVSTEKSGEAIQIQSVFNDGDDLLVYVQNVGEGVVQLEEDGCLYVDGVLVDCVITNVTVSDRLATLNEGETATLRYSGGATLPGVRVRIKVTTSRGNSAEKYAYPAGSTRAIAVLDHFAFAYIASPQVSGVQFSITVRAMDQYDEPFTDYSGVNTLTCSGGEVSPATTGSFTNGIWTGEVTVTGLATDATLTTVAQSDHSLTGTSNAFAVLFDEPIVTRWNQTYGGSEDDFAWSVIETSGGGYAIAGESDDLFWLVKTD